MNLKQKAKLIAENLLNFYPNASCTLDYTHDYELLIAVRLSAQCTDKRVNIVTENLFEKFPTLEDFSSANLSDLEEIIKPCGLFKTKAKSIKEMASQLIFDYQKQLPQTLEELTKLSGIGRKSANLIMGEIFHKPAIITDTHCIRISNRLGLASTKDPKKLELELKKIVPTELSVGFCHRLVVLGREICTARSPKCDACPLCEICTKNL